MTLPGLTPSASIAARGSICVGPLAMLDVVDDGVEDLGGALDTLRLLPRRRIELEVVVRGEQERHLVGDLHERGRPLLGQGDRGLEARDVEAVAVAVAGERQDRRDQLGQR